jgi:voltage-gated potassium channel
MAMPAPSFRTRLQQLYFGDGPRARRFRYGLIVFDLVTIAVFLVSSFAREQWWMVPLDLVLAALLALDFAGRLYAEEDRRGHLLSFAAAADIVVIVSLVLPAFVDNLAFLRVARAMRLLRSYHLLRDLRADSEWFRRHEDIVQRATSLGVFIFVVTSAVFVTQKRHQSADLLLHRCAVFHHHDPDDHRIRRHHAAGDVGRLLAVLIMVVGVSLFLRLLQAIFRPNKVRQECPDCGLLVHDADAVHCKHCGRVIHIETEGAV